MTTTYNSSTIIPFKSNTAALAGGEMAEQPSQMAEPKRQFPWFRLYNEVLNDPKVQRLDGETFKGWINILCLAQKHDWTLPCVADVAFALRMTDQAAADLIQTLHRLNLLDEVPDAPASYMPHNWKGRQYKSDADPTAPARSKRYRDRNRHASVTRDETRDATDQIQSRADTEQSRYRADSDSKTDLSKAGFFNGVRKEEIKQAAINKKEPFFPMAEKKEPPKSSAAPPAAPRHLGGDLYTYSQLPGAARPSGSAPRSRPLPEDDDPNNPNIPF
jgi:hypothetical protein